MYSNYNWETKRKQLALVKAQYESAAAQSGRKLPVIVDASVRMEASMAANQQSFQFYPGQGGTPTNTEQRLSLNDGFSIFEIGVFVAKPASGTSTIFKLYSYPNAGVFSTSHVATSLDGFYNNGVLNISKEQVNYLDNYPLLNHRFVPQVQDGITGGYTTTGATAPNGLDSFDGSQNGFAPLASYINITGRDTLNINIQLPAGLAAVETNQRVVLVFRGYKAYNVAR
jgi:hypothetical protein